MKVHMCSRPEMNNTRYRFPAYVLKIEHIQGREDFIFSVACRVRNLSEEMPTSRKRILVIVREHLQAYGDMEINLDCAYGDEPNEIGDLVDKFFPELKP